MASRAQEGGASKAMGKPLRTAAGRAGGAVPDPLPQRSPETEASGEGLGRWGAGRFGSASALGQDEEGELGNTGRLPPLTHRSLLAGLGEQHQFHCHGWVTLMQTPCAKLLLRAAEGRALGAGRGGPSRRHTLALTHPDAEPILAARAGLRPARVHTRPSPQEQDTAASPQPGLVRRSGGPVMRPCGLGEGSEGQGCE